jgi:hypothetical protein
MQRYRISPTSARQLRLDLLETDSVWPDEAWAELPTEVRREVLRHLAELLSRWYASLEHHA